MTKAEKKEVVTKLAKTLRPLSPAQREFMERKVIQHRIFYTSPARCWCSHCGKEFSVSEIHREETCPFCGQKAETRKSRSNSFYDYHYSAIMTTRGDWQIVRYFLVEAHVQREGYKGGKYGFTYKPSCYCTEVLRKWYNPSEGINATESVPLKSFPNYRRIPYGYGELKYCSLNQERSDWRHEWMLKELYPKGRILPYYAKRGLTLKNGGVLDVDSYMRKVDTKPYAETLVKKGYLELANACLWDSYHYREYQQQVRIAIRHGFDFAKLEHIKDYWDYLDMLEDFHYDLTNPVYVAPADFVAEHNRLAEMRERERQERERERERIERMNELKREAEKAKICEKRKAVWGGFIIKGYGMEFIPLLSADDYKDEGQAMHHCVAGYVNRANSLILSARMQGKRVETIEIDLTSFRVVQSRAVCNGTSDHHSEILEVMKKNMGRIKERMRVSALAVAS